MLQMLQSMKQLTVSGESFHTFHTYFPTADRGGWTQAKLMIV